jgi:hypothetical protein
MTCRRRRGIDAYLSRLNKAVVEAEVVRIELNIIIALTGEFGLDFAEFASYEN